jgi:two-component system chemotaxis response regulator CheY
MVDEVLDLLTVPSEQLEWRESLPGLDPKLVRAVGRRGEQVFVVLDTEALLAPVLSSYGGSVSHSVLVCDDAIFMRTMISDILAQAGFEVVGEAETGAQAVEKYRQLKPDLVTMDIVMPDMGGIDAVREIVKNDPDAKILMCSAMGQQALVVEAIQAGAKDFVVKPFQPSRVLEAVQRVLG